jgi:D-glycero-D-manno-heptose 1,7-bisphosphate phosphatase
MVGAMSEPCAFFDRDGTLNLDAGYTHRPEDLAWTPQAREAVRALNDAGWRVVVCTNQSGVARGYFDEAAVEAFHAAMQASLAEVGARIDAFYSCPFHEDGTVERYRVADHPDRKPNPGMLRRAMADLDLDPARAFMVGDRDADLEAAAAAGLPGYLYEGGSLLAVVEQAMAELETRKS